MTTTTQAPTNAPATARWIVGPAQDLLLFLCTPVLILPAILLLQQRFASAAISTAVMAFGAMGHHLPGMLRAYGDRALFRRYRTRFVVAPVILVTLCVAFALRGSSGMLLIAYLWGVWHGWMQTYGFARIYDAKVGSFGPRVARWDFALCATWFVAGVVVADTRLFYLLRMAGEFGFAAPGADAVAALRVGVIATLIAVTLGYAANLLALQRAGRRVNPLKLLLLATSFGWWWYANVAVADILIGLILFEIFHDVQYLSIVWLFNRGRVDRDPDVGGFTRFVFRRSWGLVGLYVAMVFAYGGLGPLAEHWVTSPTAISIATALVTASTLLHFYYDGFLWKVREVTTRQSLGIDAGREAQAAPLVTRHALIWLLLLVPVAILWTTSHGRADRDSIDEARRLAASCPRSAEALVTLGTALGDAGDHDGSVTAFERALALVPDHPRARVNLVTSCYQAGRAALAAGRGDDARRLLGLAGAERPELAQHETAEGYGLWQARKLEDAILHLRTAVLLDPRFPPGQLNLALALRDHGDPRAALQHAEIGAGLLPDDAKARQLVAELRRLVEGR